LIKGLMHAIVATPTGYSLCQRTIGAGEISQRIRDFVPSGHSRVLDIGAGSGYARRMWPEEADYFPIDIDQRMLRAGGHPLAVQSDAAELPIVDGSMDMVLCKQVSHHVPEDRLDHLFDEIRRVLRPDGRFLFMDCVKIDGAVSKLLWRYDRGAHPRPESELVARLGRCFKVLHHEAHRNLHQYVLYLLAPIEPQERTSARQAPEKLIRSAG
jgi:SAM-dependent methyltransferase